MGISWHLFTKDDLSVPCECGVNQAEIRIGMGGYMQRDFRLCRGCLVATRAALKAALKALPQLPKKARAEDKLYNGEVGKAMTDGVLKIITMPHVNWCQSFDGYPCNCPDYP